MKLLGQTGVTMVEVMVGTAVLAGLALGSAYLFKTQSEAHKTVEQNVEVQAALGGIRTILASKENCARNLGGKNPITAANVFTNIVKVENGVDLSPEVYVVNGLIPGTSLKINSYALSKSYGSPAADETMLVVSFARGRAAIKDEITKTIKIVYTLDGLGNILTCYADTSDESDDLWELATNNTDIYYNAGHVGVGTTSYMPYWLNIVDDGTTDTQAAFTRYSNSYPAVMRFQRARGTQSAPTSVANGDVLGSIIFDGYRGGSFIDGGTKITGVIESAPAANSIPTALVFNTGSNISTSAERMRITSSGHVGINTGPSASSKLHIVESVALNTGKSIAAQAYNLQIPSGASTHSGIGWNASATTQGTQNNYRAIGGHLHATRIDAGKADALVGAGSATFNTGAGTITWGYGAQGYAVNNGAGTVTNAYGGYFHVYRGAGVITTGYGVLVGTIAATTKYGVYQADSTANNYFRGFFGTGVANPTQSLHVWSDTDKGVILEDPNFGATLHLRTTNANEWILNTDPTTGALEFIQDDFSNAPAMALDYGTSRVGMGTTAPTEVLHVVGNILASGSVTAVSDKRLKKNFESIDRALEKLLTLNGMTYEWKKPIEETKGRHLGVIAQDVQKAFPEAVRKTNDGHLAVSYPSLVAPLIEASKELNAKDLELDKLVTQNERSIASLKEKNGSLKAQNIMLKSYICKKNPEASFCK